MTLRQLGDVVIYVGAVAGGLAAITLLLRWTVVRPIRGWVESAAKDSRAALAQVEPNGGTRETTRHLIEETATRVEQLVDTASQNRELATSALALGREVSERLDRHIADPTAHGIERANHGAD